MLPQGASPSVRRYRSTQSPPTQGKTLQDDMAKIIMSFTGWMRLKSTEAALRFMPTQKKEERTRESFLGARKCSKMSEIRWVR